MNETRIHFSEELLNFFNKLSDVDVEKLIESYHTPLPESIRINTLKVNVEECLGMLHERGFDIEKIPWTKYGYIVRDGENISETIEHMLGLIYIQGPISMLVSELLDVKPGQAVLDLCAAPGSKSTHIAQLMNNMGVLVANDISYERIKALSSNLQKCGVINSVITLKDGRMYGRRFPNTFDRVLVDAPCSSLGVIQKDWSVAKKWVERISIRISRLQLSLLLSGFDSLKPGGVMVYATCTLHPLENEWVVNQLLEKRGDKARLVEVNVEGLKYSKPLLEWNGERFSDDISKCIRIYPYQSGAEGFFIAKIYKEY